MILKDLSIDPNTKVTQLTSKNNSLNALRSQYESAALHVHHLQ